MDLRLERWGNVSQRRVFYRVDVFIFLFYYFSLYHNLLKIDFSPIHFSIDISKSMIHIGTDYGINIDKKKI